MAKEITDAEFKKEVEEFTEVAFVDFWASWCGPCMAMAPVFSKVGEKYPAIKFLKINTEDNLQKASELGVNSIPCIIVFKGGKEVERLIGYKPEATFEAAVIKYV